MGNRLHKRMGYGIELTPEQITTFLTVPEYEDYKNKFTLNGYLDFLEKTYYVAPKDSILNLDYIKYKDGFGKDIKNSWGNQVLVYNEREENPESITPALLLITPLCVTEEWIRWDDSIDYAETKENSMEPQLIKLTQNPFPFLNYDNPPPPVASLVAYLNLFTKEAKEEKLETKLLPYVFSYWS